MTSKVGSRTCARTFAVLSLLASVVLAVGCGGTDTTATLVVIAVTPATPTIAKGGTQQFVATGTYSDKTTKNLSSTATWTSSIAATATVSATGLATGVAAGTAAISATRDGVTGSTSLTVTGTTIKPPVLTSIAVTPAAPSIAKGSTQQFVATGTFDDATTKDLSALVNWSSAASTIATISTTGLATGLAKGTTTISATSGPTSGSVTLTVTAATLATIAVTPTNPSIAKGTTQQLVATGTFDDGTKQDLSATATWTSATPATATVSNKGLATGVAGGMSVISAASSGVTGSTTLTVTVAKLKTIAVTPATPTIATGTKQPFVATGTFDDNSVQDLSASVTWTSSVPAAATIADAAPAKGVASAVAPGMTVISAKLDDVTGMTTLTVKMADLKSIAVTPGTPSIAKGTTQKFVATGTFADNTTQDLTTQVTWSSGTPATASISNVAGSVGLATSLVKGTTVISAKLGAITGTATLTVTDATLVSIAIAPPTPRIARLTRVQLTATGTYTDSTTQDLTTAVTWTSSATAAATVSNAAGSSGLATGVAAGTPTISATIGLVTGKVTLTVTNETLVSIVVTPVTQTLAAGTRQQYIATGFFTDASKQDVTATATWASATTATATISNAAGSRGLATAVALGSSEISAAIGTIRDTATLTVTRAVLTSIAITPPTPMIAKGTRLSLVATGTFTDATTQPLTNAVTWSSGTTTVATISNAAGTNGQVSGIAEGMSVITATIDTISAAVTLVVSPAALSALAVTPTTPTIAKGTKQQFVATGTFTDATTQDLSKTVTWKSDTPAIATISNAAGSVGLATAAATGATVISATSGTIVGSTTLTVNDGKLASIAVTAATATIAAGTRLQFVATGTFDDGAKQDITDDVTWASETVATATISNADDRDGLATGVARGTTRISATQGTITGSTILTVTAAQLVSIVVTPGTASIAKGTTQPFVATGFFDDTSTQDLTDSVAWAAATPAVAGVSNAPDSSGVATGLTVGMTNVTATLGPIVSVPVALTVTPAVLRSIAITPATPSLARGARLQFAATGTFSDATTQVLTTRVTWATAAAATATISNATGSRGLATGVAVGMTDVSATSGTIAAHVTLVVTPAVIATIAVTPANPSIARTRTQQFVATATLTDGTRQDVSATATWASATEATATISNTAGSKGLATGVAAGASQISAATSGVTGRTTLTVTN